jgi:23S rRNA (cytidine1920-2'-O)/16S rRNA (cytidine1409-2'-O)-methyltransferase
MSRRRLDLELVRRGLADSRAQAQELIGASKVLVGGAVASKPARMVAPGDPVVLTAERPRFVSRGGEKLAAALEHFQVEVGGRRILDAGASTGGFTDCCLQNGAAWVAAVDVGHGQLHERIRGHRQVLVLERTNVRRLTPDDIGGLVSLIVGDLSFISLRTVLPALVSCLEPQGELVMLVKPQFEAGRTEVSKGRGIVRDPEIWARVLREVSAASLALELGIMGIMVSPLHGADGNTEFLLHARLRSTDSEANPDLSSTELDTNVDAAVAIGTQRLLGTLS